MLHTTQIAPGRHYKGHKTWKISVKFKQKKTSQVTATLVTAE